MSRITKVSSSLRLFLVSLMGILLFLAPLHITTQSNTHTLSKNSLSTQKEHSLFIAIETSLVFAEETKTKITEYMSCTLTGGANGVTGCFALGAYYLAYMPASYILATVGNFFDIVLKFSISKALIDQDFVKTVWTNVRDLNKKEL